MIRVNYGACSCRGKEGGRERGRVRGREGRRERGREESREGGISWKRDTPCD